MKSEGRFEFGKNWQDFLSVLNEERIKEAKASLSDFIDDTSLVGKKFLDIGSGSGLFSLAAKQMGAEVSSFDYDEFSVKCTRELKDRYFPQDPNWRVEQGSVLDREFVERLGPYDICYSWGVLHHTGNLWQALYNSQLPLREGGVLFLAIYNDQGLVSSFWEIVKKAYCSGKTGRVLLTVLFYPCFFVAGLLMDITRLKDPTLRYREHKKHRGMSLIHDWKDWLGGYPYEYATPERVIGFCENLGHVVCKMKPTMHGFGNNQYLFKKISKKAV